MYFVTKKLADSLKIPVEEHSDRVLISRLENNSFSCSHFCNFTMSSRISSFSLTIEADVVEKISYIADIELVAKLK